MKLLFKKTRYFLFLFLLFNFSIRAQEESAPLNQSEGLTIVSVGEAQVEKEKITILPASYEGKFSLKEKSLIRDLENLMLNDFNFYRKHFYVPDNKNLVNLVPSSGPLTPSDYDLWATKSTDFLVLTDVIHKDKNLEFTVKAYNIKMKKEIFKESFILNETSLRTEGHRINNEIYRSITGKDSIFISKMIFICDMGTIQRSHPIKELFISDFDGFNLKRLTHHNGIVISPAISYDRNFIVYSLILKGKGVKNVDLYLMDIQKNTSKVLSSRSGINSGGVFLPSGDKIALTLSYQGNADIYLMDLASKDLRKLTNHPSDDVDPSFSPDGQKMAFLSGRPGKAMIYTMDTSATEKNVTRMTFVGKFNATPRFSFDGKEIVFASWSDESFDIYRLNSDGQGLVRLTKNFGQNEDPSFSNDGQFIVFSSTRTLNKSLYQKNVYIMDRDGEILGPITQNMGNCLSPRWSN